MSLKRGHHSCGLASRGAGRGALVRRRGQHTGQPTCAAHEGLACSEGVIGLPAWLLRSWRSLMATRGPARPWRNVRARSAGPPPDGAGRSLVGVPRPESFLECMAVVALARFSTSARACSHCVSSMDSGRRQVRGRCSSAPPGGACPRLPAPLPIWDQGLALADARVDRGCPPIESLPPVEPDSDGQGRACGARGNLGEGWDLLSELPFYY